MSSNTTETLIGLLRVRDEAGLAKYGTTLDRTDLTIEDWLHHGLEEALDLAGYLQCAKRQIGVLRDELAGRDAQIARLAGENLRLRSVLLPFVELAKTISLEAPESSQVPPPSEAPVVCAFSTLTDTVENVELPVEKPVVNILNETNGQIIQEPTLTESILTEIIGENFTQVLPPSVSEPMPLPISLPRGMLSSVQFAERLQVAPSTLSGYIKQGLVVPAGQYLTRGMKSMCFRPSQLDPLRVILRQKAMERKAPPVGAAYTKSAAPEGFLTSKEAAALLGVAASSLCKAVSIGTLKIHTPGGSGKLGIFEREEIERYRAQKAINLARTATNLNKPKVEPEVQGSPEITPKHPVVIAPAPAPKAPKVVLTPLPEPKAIMPPAPAFDTNEEGRYNQIEEGKTTYRAAKIFYLARRTTDTRYLWECQPSTACDPGWELIEEWRCNGLGRWESTPEVPGHVGTRNGVTMGARGYTVPVLG